MATKSYPLYLNIVLLFCVAVFLRFLKLDHIPAINGDEAFPTVQMREMTMGHPVLLWVPTQRLLSPLYAGLVLIVQYLFPAVSLWTVRAPALIAGICLIFLSYFLLEKRLGKKTAFFATLLIATLPMTIAYSRSAVEQSLMGLAALFPIYFALQGRIAASFAAYCVAILIHPVDVFLMPVIILPLFAQTKKYYLFPLFLLVVALLLSALPGTYGLLNLESVSSMVVHTPWYFIKSFGAFLVYYLRLLSGVTAFEYFSVPPPVVTAYFLDFFLGILVLGLLILGVQNLYRSKDRILFWYALGFFATLLCLFCVAGPRVLQPGLSRHANVLVVPSAILFAICLNTLSGKISDKKLYWGLSAFAWLMLASFWQFYFVRIEQTGGGYTHRTYATGPVEPKAAVYSWIVEAAAGKPTVIIAEDWWTYWPLRYLALPNEKIEVLQLDKGSMDLFDKGAYAVGFQDGPIQSFLKEHYPPKSIVEYTPESYSKQFVLSVWQKKH